MMWAATVRRCPTGHSRHPSQFGARMQLARALNHAPYLICDGVYPCPADTRYGLPCPEPPASLHEPDIICDHVVDCDSSYRSSYSSNSRHGGSPQPVCRMESPAETPYITYPRQQNRRPHEMRVELSYGRREFDAPEDYHVGHEPVVRRYEDFRQRDTENDEGPVGLSYQQRSMGGGGPYGGQVWGAEPSIDCWGDRPMLLKRGRTREIVRTFFVVGLSLTCITFVIMGFGVYNMLITTLFLFFLLSTVSLLIFLLMRKPSCFNCCSEPFDLTNSAEEDPEVQQGLSTYLTESQGVVLKKRLSDSPPPYESPPDYHSLPPEVLVSARGLSGLESSPETFMARVHGEPQGRNTPRGPQRRNRIRRFAQRSSSTLLASAAPLLSGAAKRTSPPASPPICTSSRILGLTSCRPPTENNRTSETPPPPPYECVVIQTDKGDDDPKRC